MIPPSRRPQYVTVALPGSLTLDIPHLREKTARIGFIARALAAFRMDRVVVYHDREGDVKIAREAKLVEKMLMFIETPQYLRKYLFKMDPDLQYAGTLPPLRTPNHPNREDPKLGLLREGVVTHAGLPSEIQGGFTKPISVNSRLEISSRVTIKLTKISPRLEGEIVDVSRLTIYWGFKVARGHVSLSEMVRSKEFDLAISTSRSGVGIRQVTPDVATKWKSSKHPLIIFGSPTEGIPEILARSKMNMSETMDFNLNMIPDQGVETVRTEEALWSSLAVLNILVGT